MLMASGLTALMVLTACEQEGTKGGSTLDNPIQAFPARLTDIPDPETLSRYPYDPNLLVPYDYSSISLAAYPESDSSQIDPVDWPIWIPKAESSLTIQEFLAYERAILPETTLTRLGLENPEYFEGEDGGTLEESTGNDCDFSKNRRGDVLLVRNPWVPVPIYHKHAGVWRGTEKENSIYRNKEIVHSISSGVCWASDGSYLSYWNHCRVMRVNTSPHSTNYRNVAATYCENQYGKPYNYNWLWKYDEQRFYCSQLAWAGYWRCGAKNPRIDIDIYCIHYIPQFGFVPDFHVAPDEIWINWRTYQIAKSSGKW